MKAYLHNMLIGLDQLLNASTGGDPDETICSRVGKAQRGDHGWPARIVLTPVAWMLNLAMWYSDGWDHCIRCIEADEGKAELVLG